MYHILINSFRWNIWSAILELEKNESAKSLFGEGEVGESEVSEIKIRRKWIKSIHKLRKACKEKK